MIVTIAGTPFEVRPTDDQLGAISIVTAAFDGEVGNGTFPVPDPDNVLTAVTGRQFLVEEGSTVLSDGFMLDQDRTRGTEPQGRDYGFGIQDANALLDGFRIARSRPSELDYDRVLAFAALDGPTWDTTWVLETEGVTMPAKKYYSDGGWTSELIPDVVAFTGKTLFLHDKAAGGRCLHYHNLVSGHGCGLSISDDIADVDHVTVWEPWEPVRQRTSVDLRNSIKGVDQAGRTSIQSDAGSIAAHDADGLQHESQPSFEAVSQGDLDVQTAAMLASIKGDLDTWTCQIGPLDETALALIRVGDIISVTSAVMGLSDDDQRISHLTLTPAIGEAGTAVPDVWMATLEMGAPIRRRRRKRPKSFVDRVEHTPVVIIGGPPGGCFDVGDLGSWSNFAGTPLTAPVGGSILVDRGGFGSTIIFNPTAGTLVGTQQFYGSVGIIPMDVALPDAIAATVTFDLNIGAIDPDPLNLLYLNFSLGQDGVSAGVVSYQFRGTGGLTEAPPLWDSGTSYVIGDIVRLFGFGNYIATANNTNQVPPNASFWADEDFAYSANQMWKGKLYVNSGQRSASIWSATDEEPPFPNFVGIASTPGTNVPFDAIGAAIGQFAGTFPGTVSVANIVICFEVPEETNPVAYHWTVYGPVAPQETPDGATDTFTIPAYPGSGYVPGTLVIAVEGIDQVTEQTDPAAGTGTISWMPTADDLVTMCWLVP